MDTIHRIRYCVSCGRREGTGPNETTFGSVYTPRCKSCTVEIRAEKSQRKARYRNARYRAMTRLANDFPSEYTVYLREEQAKDRAEAEAEAAAESNAESEAQEAIA